MGKEAIEGIFTEILKRNVEKEWDLNELLVQKMACSSLELSRKIVGGQDGQGKEVFSVLRRVLAGFGKLKIK
jgi:hypothetical protein